MKIRPARLLYFNKNKHINNNHYGLFTIEYAVEWAELMEKKIMENRITAWKSIVAFMECNAEDLSLLTEHCKSGLTGFQHSCATSLLINSWEYGFELWLGLSLDKYRKGHNINDTQKKYVDYYLDQDYSSILEFKKSVDGIEKLEENTTHLIQKY